MITRKKVFQSDRIKVTENLIKKVNASAVLEIGAADHSFEYVYNNKSVSWLKVDFSQPCDVMCDLNSLDLQLPFKDKIFDLIICTEVLEHLLWPQYLLKECNRLLTDRGKILISVPNISSLSYRIAWMMGRIPSCAASGNLPIVLGSTAYKKENGDLVGGHVIDFNLRRTIKLMEFSGFKQVKLKGAGIIWHKQILPHWVVPISLSSNIICLAEKK